MVKRIENTIILTRLDKPIQESSLESNERKVMEYWKVSYDGLPPTEHPRGEIQRYRKVIDSISFTRENEPKKIVISFKTN